ncbi:hypothetical protein A8139_11475 [Marinomonas primoryensis]|uniref:Peptidase M48 domain-containing protein n=1 Tax=Marinomonas primoryensis TaxID=178399 RepID=A0A2Z4PTU2_9GAMM|nr:M56 family metallopeptidase [Marinomonas primoryensis]AWY00539.1 hypothetical protein A8139_11475 [Marinomonas primoryensis]
MTHENLSLILHLLYIISITTLILGALCWLINPFFIKWVTKFNPQSRLILLRSFGSIPLVGALVIGAMISIPALSHSSALPIDHCHVSTNCMGPPASHMVTISELAVIGAALCIFCWASLIAFMQWRRSRTLLERLDATSCSMLSPNVQLIETELPLAFSLGIFRPNAVLSTGLVNNLSSEQLHIVCTHEEVHAQYRDSFYKWILRFMCTFHYPSVKRGILQEHALSLELRVDQQVARSTQCNVAVAEAIVKVQRLMSPIKNEGPLCQFLGTELELRVHYLLEQTTDSVLPKHTLLLSIILVLIFSVCGSLPLHNTVEALITR